jgi:glycosyltransferase involved in cell wall biosynthesis
VSRLLTIVRPGIPLPPASAGERVVGFDEFMRWIRSGRVVARIGRYQEGRLLVQRLETAGRPLPLGLALRAVSRGRISVVDVSGRSRRLTAAVLGRWAAQLAAEPLRVRSLIGRVGRTVDELAAAVAARPARRDFDPAASPWYLRTDLSFGVRAGGSVAHIAGVVNELDGFTGPVKVLTTDDIPTLRPDVEVHHVWPLEAFWNFKELPTLMLNDAFVESARTLAAPPSFIYQRYSLNSFAGIRLALQHRVPFVLEYNGSEIWMGRHWGRPLRHEELSSRIEVLNFGAADLIVVVSRPMQDELIARGVAADKIFVNPNGVDADRYRPDVDGSAVRAHYDLRDDFVIGFIGTFGPWHGAEVLADAFVRLIAADPMRRGKLRLLMIGDGARLEAVRRILADGGVADRCVFTGLVAQEDGPAHLAACDILSSPHVPNPDGTPFFGSPTKLFEYMAMGKPIVASNLEQIGEVLEHRRTAWMVRPNDSSDLADGLRQLVEDPALRAALGSAARREALDRYTWREHTRRTVDRLLAVVGGRTAVRARA